MVRDRGLETMIGDELARLRGITEKGMFGGWAWLLDGHLLCGARAHSLLVRLGRDRDAWALAIDGVEPMFSGTRRMHGWVRAAPHVYDDAAIRRRLLDGAIAFVRSLPPK